MMAMERAPMSDDAPQVGGQIGRIAILVVAGLGAVFGAGVFAGILAAHADRGGGAPTPAMIGLLGGAALLTAAAIFLAWRQVNAMTRAGGAPTPRERRNRTVLLVCGAIGGVMGACSACRPDAAQRLHQRAAASLAGGRARCGHRAADPDLSSTGTPASPTSRKRRLIPRERCSASTCSGSARRPGGCCGGAACFRRPMEVVIYFATVAVAGAIWMWAKYR